MKVLSGLETINIELTSRCNKNCWMCGRRLRDKNLKKQGKFKENSYGDMSFELLEKIAKEIPPDITIALHNNGEPTLYPKLKEAIILFKEKGCLTNFVTNGKLLLERFDDIVDKLDTMSISIFENDSEWKEQNKIINKFLKLKKGRKPFTILRIIGDVLNYKYEHFNILTSKRYLHSPKGSFDYIKNSDLTCPTIPETGVCLDFLHHLAIDRFGNVSCCVRFDPKGELILGNIEKDSLDKIWHSEKRMQMKELHITGRRNMIPFCSECDFYGIPTGGN